jgi:putative two-component system response regulator
MPGDDHCFPDSAMAQMERFVEDFGRMYRERNQLLQQVTRAHHETLLHLSVAADYEDDDTGVHIVRIGYLAEALALLLGQSPAYASMLRKAAPMHDIGKIGTPDHVLKKPGPLDAHERDIMTRHPVIGAEILSQSRVPVFTMAADIALTHHEKYDGTGYPYGLRGEDIPLAGRITSVVDIFDALTMDRVYRPALAVEDAVQIIAAERGKALDPRIVDTFLAHVDALDALRRRITNECPNFAALIDAP